MVNSHPFSHFPPEPDEDHAREKSFRIINKDNAAFFKNDAAFDWMYPEHLQLLSLKQWTRLAVARKAARFLARPGARVLDIGSGIGKFCLAAAHLYPGTNFFGVEQRGELVHFAEEAGKYLQLSNVHFTQANITQINFREFDHFYFYNSFYENLDPDSCIDDTIATSSSLYFYYTLYLLQAFDDLPAGTRLVTFHTLGEEIPSSYRLVKTSWDMLLKMWIKQ
ncbi:class I SAM-dependent methyltransferase [Mucilaginibacter sp.]|jgi:SAM-dependent methyltransferase|uniref:class I SAM-dependent methyltransferase n=1 Tax=Mucilaginibacter sp. TaxID=1882438 RepID=UPI002BFE6AB6|nr:class I SAM-dependent methyltransferase [Mucilaginibacter sp.]HTI59942.1 class I SAM-dependent methyltransferase [Mucilaginibacter sp.]